LTLFSSFPPLKAESLSFFFDSSAFKRIFFFSFLYSLFTAFQGGFFSSFLLLSFYLKIAFHLKIHDNLFRLSIRRQAVFLCGPQGRYNIRLTCIFEPVGLGVVYASGA
jgi:hypothetical protein